MSSFLNNENFIETGKYTKHCMSNTVRRFTMIFMGKNNALSFENKILKANLSTKYIQCLDHEFIKICLKKNTNIRKKIQGKKNHYTDVHSTNSFFRLSN